MRNAARAIVIKDDHLLVMHRNKYGSQYYTLPGGGIDAGESAEQAVIRELAEETGVTVALERLVFIENPGERFGHQYIFLCSYVAGEPMLHPESEEAISNGKGHNLYTPQWLPLTQLADAPFMSPALRAAIQKAVVDGFPESPKTL